MDRLARLFSGQLALLLAGVAAAGLPWLASQYSAPSHPKIVPAGEQRSAPGEMICPSSTLVDQAAPLPSTPLRCSDESPALLPFELAPRSAADAVLPTAFPNDPSIFDAVNGVQGSPPQGPLLFADPATAKHGTGATLGPTSPATPSKKRLPASDRDLLVGEPVDTPIAGLIAEAMTRGRLSARTTPLPNAQAKVPAPSSPEHLEKAEGTLLIPPSGLVPRSEQLERIAQEADRHSRYGFELAGRNAFFAARSEFVTALRLVAQGLDAEHQTNKHTRALAAGLTAMREAEDFIPSKGQMDVNANVAAAVALHQTPVLKDTDESRLVSMFALRCYFTFAQEQLATAMSREVAGSMALHGLGKLNAALASQPDTTIRGAESRTVTFFQAALLTNPKNSMAANDLGVFLAKYGRYAESQQLLERALLVQQHPATWQNLAKVYHALGQVELARRANGRAEAMQLAEKKQRPAANNGSRPMVRWLDPPTFAKTSTDTPRPGQPAPIMPLVTPAKGQPKQAKRPETKKEASTQTGWLPWDLFTKGNTRK